MAFPVPDHLPRRPKPLDVSSQILSKIDEANTKTLNPTLTSQWLKELDATILATKKTIHERILKDLPAFEQQFGAAKSVQARLTASSSGMERIDKELTGEEGLITQLSERLTAHSRLAQETQDAVVMSNSLQYLQKCKAAYGELTSLVTKGELPAAMTACRQFESLLQDAPPMLHSSRVYSDIKAKFRVTKDRAEEQLNDAYSRAIVVTATDITVNTSVQVQNTDVTLTLERILQSLAPATRTAHLTTLRRNVVSHYVESLLTQPMSVTVTSQSDGSSKLSKFPSPPESDHPKARLGALTETLAFLAKHVFTYFPDLPLSLCKPVSDGVLKEILVASIPATFDSLPPFLELVRFAASFEEEHIQGVLGNDPRDCPIKQWAENASGHYERNRRQLILAKARGVICRPEDTKDTFTVEVVEVVPVQESKPADDPWGFEETQEEKDTGKKDAKKKDVENDAVDDDAWGFGDEDKKTVVEDHDADDSWGFDDIPPAKPSQPSQPVVKVSAPKEPVPKKPAAESDPGDAWGWNEDESTSTEDVWDDPWNDPPSKPEPVKSPSPPPPPVSPPPILSPRPASGLAKFAAKKAHLNGNGNGHPPSAPSTPPPVSASPKPALGLGKHAAKNKSVNSLVASNGGSRPSTPPPVSASPKPALGLGKYAAKNRSVSSVNGGSRPSTPYSPALSSYHSPTPPPPPAPALEPTPPKRPPKLVPPEPIKEKYVVSGRARDILHFVRDTIRESEECASSDLFTKSDGQPGTLLRQSATSILDLHKAIYPVKFSSVLMSSLDCPMRFSNDCLYLAQEFEGDSEQAEECKRRLKLLGESWFDDTIHKHRQSINELLEGAQGFALLGEQDQFDEAENAVNQSLQKIRKVAGSWKPILTRSKYYSAVGSLVDAALSRVLDDVLALPDIPEVESHRVSELCRIFNALEALFVEDPEKPSMVVAWVPSWLKFSYLSELLEASMADITYLFEEGALVDFELDELTKLVKALFADTPLRANTINRIMGGHPVAQ